MQEMAIKYSPLALSDLIDIRDYIAIELQSPQAAGNTVGKITKKIRKLETMPQIGTKLSAVCNIATDYQFLASGNYLIFYRCEDEAVYIVRVLYRARNYLSVLFSDELEQDPINLFN